jgi:alpha-galactosidase
MVAADAASAVFTITQAQTSVAYPPGRVRLPGLAHDRLYRVRVIVFGDEGNSGQSALAWTQHDTILTGRELEAVGLRPPVQLPQQATVVELTSVP